jgi:hypothetical protein
MPKFFGAIAARRRTPRVGENAKQNYGDRVPRGILTTFPLNSPHILRRLGTLFDASR